MRQPTIYYLILLCIGAWCALLLLAPIAALSPATEGFSSGLYSIFGRICHQYDSHSMHIAGHKLAVCARCSSIYFGFFVGALLAPLGFLGQRRRTITWLLLAVAPMLLDVGLDFTGVHSSTILLRVITGGWFGILAGQLLIPYLLDGIAELSSFFSTNSRKMYESQT